MKQTKITFNLQGLEDLKKEVGDTYRARVGILGGNAARKDDKSDLDNATLGTIQMFGSVTNKIPPRDFLLMPIQSHAREIVGEMRKESVKKAIASGQVKKVYELLGAAATEWVLKAFESAGFGQWPPNSDITIARKKSSQPLIDTGQLRRAITSDVVKRGESRGKSEGHLTNI